jgi:hypothetical protein
METRPNTKKQKKELKSKKTSLIYFLAGGILTEEFIIKQIPMFIAIVVVVFMYIGNRYSCHQKINEITVLKDSLQTLEYQSLFLSAEITEHKKRSQLEVMVEQMGLDLKMLNTPTIEIK